MQPHELILEGIVTTQNVDGSTAIAPMGPVVDRDIGYLVFRPYTTSNTYANLCRTRQGVFHVTDNVLMLAQAAIGRLQPPPRLTTRDAVQGKILADACRWYAFRIVSIDDRQARASLRAEITAAGWQRDFFGLNRAKHAVVEAAILATRSHLLPERDIRAELDRLAVLVDKTGGRPEREAFDLLRAYLAKAWERTDE